MITRKVEVKVEPTAIEIADILSEKGDLPIKVFFLRRLLQSMTPEDLAKMREFIIDNKPSVEFIDWLAKMLGEFAKMDPVGKS